VGEGRGRTEHGFAGGDAEDFVGCAVEMCGTVLHTSLGGQYFLFRGCLEGAFGGVSEVKSKEFKVLAMVYRHCGVTTPTSLRWLSILEAEAVEGMQEW
jgi:hypothetical protein